jgi:hypothetical protein
MAKKKKGENTTRLQPKVADAINQKLKDIQYNEKSNTLDFLFDNMIIKVYVQGNQLSIKTERSEK